MRLNLITWFLIPAIGLVFITNYFIQGVRSYEALGKQSIVNQKDSLTENSNEAVKSFFVKEGRGVLTFWFDDAWDTQYDVGFSTLQSRNIKGTLAVPTLAVGKIGYMGWWHIQKLQHKGWEITAHTRTHECEADKISSDNLTFELLGSKLDLESKNIQADNYVAPCGTITDETTELVRKYYRSQRTSNEGLNALPVKDPYLLKSYVLNKDTSIDKVKELISEAKTSDTWLILVFHQLDSSQDKYSINPELFKDIVDEVVKSGIQTALPKEVLSL